MPKPCPECTGFDCPLCYGLKYVRVEEDYLAADGKPVLAGERFHQRNEPTKHYRVAAVTSLFVFLDADGWTGPPKVVKRWKMASKDWVHSEG